MSFDDAKADDDWGVDANENIGDDGWGDVPCDDDSWSSAADSSMPPAISPLLTRQQSFQIMDQQGLLDKQDALIKQTAEVLDVSLSEAGCLLRHYGWKSRQLQQEWFNDQQAVRDRVGLSSAPIPTFAPGTMVQCQTAYDDAYPSSQVCALSCGHVFCDGCWTAYLQSQIKHGRTCIFTTCMGMKCQLDHPHKFACACNQPVPEELFYKYVKDAELLDKYKRWLLNSFVEGQAQIKWCPKPGCNYAMQYQSGGMKSVQCRCGHIFCFTCGLTGHSPAPCDLAKKWLEREQSDDATEIWLAARTKGCPSCGVRIEKNKACNHMTCIKCGHHFCWLCKDDWKNHGSSSGGYYICKKYDEDIKAGIRSEEEQKIATNQQLLQKYTFYYKRYKSSADAIDFTQKLGQKLEKSTKNEEYQKFSFLYEAIDKLIAARRVLQWTYALAYYLKSGGQKHLFEYQQEMLCGSTEALQDIMDTHIADIDQLSALRKDIINKTSSIDKFRLEMVAQVERGDFEDLLLSQADSFLDGWTCVNCKADNKREEAFCVICTSCKLHGENDCKGCKPPNK